MDTEIIEHEPNYRMPVHYMGMDIPDVVEMTKWRDGEDVITTYRDGKRFWHFRVSPQSDDGYKGEHHTAPTPWGKHSRGSEPFNPYFSFKL